MSSKALCLRSIARFESPPSSGCRYWPPELHLIAVTLSSERAGRASLCSMNSHVGDDRRTHERSPRGEIAGLMPRLGSVVLDNRFASSRDSR